MKRFEKLKFNSKLIFDQHISDLFKKAKRKVKALAQITPYMSQHKRRQFFFEFFFQITV